MKPNKNRKIKFNAPPNIRRKFASASLSPPLKAEHGVRSMVVRKDDTVLITKGDRKLTEGRVMRLDYEKSCVFLEGVSRQRLDGTTIYIPVKTANIMITKLNLDDRWRRKILERRGYKLKR
ncbi:MAG: 50S ribosomal protein L24 [Candidatus Bathyarchaeia archaeon]